MLAYCVSMVNKDEKNISKAAVTWIRRPANKRQILAKYADKTEYKPAKRPLIVFMAGSPGAGKTEFVKDFRKSLEVVMGIKPVVIDPDEIRKHLPGYKGNNSFLFQQAISIAVDDLFNHVINNSQTAIIDGTLSDYARAKKNIDKALTNNPTVLINYVFQHPTIAWRFTQLREAVEGRNIRKTDFIDRFINAKETVDKLKQIYKAKIHLNLILKDYRDSLYNQRVAKVFTKASRVEDHIEFKYTKEELDRILSEIISEQS